MDWIACERSGLVKGIKPDRNLIVALMKSSARKLASQRLLSLNDDTATSKISLAYDALRELLEALAISRGHKVYNHECYHAFLKEIMRESTLAERFNTFRLARNDINYYGKDVGAAEAKGLIDGMAQAMEDIRKRHLKEDSP